MLTKLISIIIIFFTILSSIQAAPQQPDWTTAISPPNNGPQDSSALYSSIETTADVQVSDGLQYQVKTSWQDNERVIFHRQYSDKIVTLGRQGHYFWVYDGKQQKDTNNKVLDFILGHQFHAQLLFFDQFYLALQDPLAESNRCDCWAKPAKDLYDNDATLHFHKDSLRPMYLITNYQKHGEVIVQFTDWRPLKNLNFPYHIDIYHGDRKFSYQFSEIKLNSWEKFQSLKTPMTQLTDEQQLYQLHRDMIDAHIESDAQLMQHVWGEQVTFVNRGKINQLTGTAAAKGMQSSLKARKHSIYVDLEQPIIKISNDKSMAYLTARVKAKGKQVSKDGTPGRTFQFTSAWIATFEKVEGQWKLVSNASNFES